MTSKRVGDARMRPRPGRRGRQQSSRKCWETGKKRFRDKKAAIAVLHHCVATFEMATLHGVVSRRREERCYECQRCGGWHLTSQPA